jgi:IS1 family transposase
MEIDEMHTDIGLKKYCWIWLFVVRQAKKIINCEFGSRGCTTGQKLWTSVKSLAIKDVMTADWKPYILIVFCFFKAEIFMR